MQFKWQLIKIFCPKYICWVKSKTKRGFIWKTENNIYYSNKYIHIITKGKGLWNK